MLRNKFLLDALHQICADKIPKVQGSFSKASIGDQQLLVTDWCCVALYV